MAKKEAPPRNYKSGSIYVDNSKNLLYASIVSPSGKRIKESFALNDRSSADRWLTEKRMEFYDSIFIDPSLITLGEWVLYWLENYVSISVKPITQRGYKESILYLTPLFDYRLQDITRDLLQKHLKEMENGGYAPSTLEKVKKRLKHLFNYAIENKKVSENPANQLQQIKKNKAFYKNKNFIFATDIGDPIHPNSIHKGVKRLLQAAGETQTTTVHALRHSYASLLFAMGEDSKIIQTLLGHSSIKTTLDIYVHPEEQNKKSAIDKINNLTTNGGKNGGK